MSWHRLQHCRRFRRQPFHIPIRPQQQMKAELRIHAVRIRRHWPPREPFALRLKGIRPGPLALALEHDPSIDHRQEASGIDAQRVFNRLPQMRQYPETRIDGATGLLSLTQDGRIQRDLAWGQIQDGLLQPAVVERDF